MTRRELLAQLRTKYSFEVSHSIIQIAAEDGYYENSNVIVKVTHPQIGSHSFNIEWKEV